MNKFARSLRDNYGISYTTALRLIRERGLDAAIEFCDQQKAAPVAPGEATAPEGRIVSPDPAG